MSWFRVWVFEPDIAAGVVDPERAAVGAANTTPENAAATLRNHDQVSPQRVIRALAPGLG